MIDYLRVSLYAVVVLVGFLLFQAWTHEHQQQTETAAEPVPMVSSSSIPEVKQTSTTIENSPIATVPPSKGELVHVVTDSLDVTIDTHGGDILGLRLVKYPESLHSKTPYTLLNDSPKTTYIAESGLLSKIGPDTSQGQGVYTAEKTEYVLAPDQNALYVKLNWQSKEGVKVVKTFTFQRDSYEILVTYEVINQSKQAWEGNLYTQLMRTDSPPETSEGFTGLSTYFGAAISTPNKAFQKITFKQMTEKNLSETVKGGWTAMIQHYFVSAWIPDKDSVSNYYSKTNANGVYTIGAVGPSLFAAPGATAKTEAKLYSGPAIADKLEQAAPGLKLTIDFGWFWFISVILFWLMQKVYTFIGNWGWSIIIVTVLIKVMFYQLSAKSYRSMSMLKKLQPRIEALKARFGDDKQKFTQATLDLYRQEKVNPMSGCLPIIIQIPVFIALYWVLVESVELRQAPFMLWIQDLSVKDPYYILPLLMGVSMFLQQRLNPPPPDPMQAKVMMLMPIIFTVLFINFPAGLMLYWFVNNTLSFLQQWHIMHKLNKEDKGKKIKVIN